MKLQWNNLVTSDLSIIRIIYTFTNNHDKVIFRILVPACTGVAIDDGRPAVAMWSISEQWPQIFNSVLLPLALIFNAVSSIISNNARPCFGPWEAGRSGESLARFSRRAQCYFYHSESRKPFWVLVQQVTRSRDQPPFSVVFFPTHDDQPTPSQISA
jgi:hypothetical protein